MANEGRSLVAGVVALALLAASVLVAVSAQEATAQSADQSAAERCSEFHLFGAEPVDVAKTADGKTVLAQVRWGFHDGICFLTLDDDALAALRAAGPSPSLPTGETDDSRRCFKHHRFGAEPVDVAKTADGQTVLFRVSWGWNGSICFLALDSAAINTLRTAEQTPDAPTDLTAAAGNSQIAVSWNEPADTGGLAITVYTLSYKATTSGCPITLDATWTVRTISNTSVTISGLTNGTAYRLCVKAANTGGDSRWVGTTVTPATTPGAVGNVDATAGDGQFTVTWTAPSNNGGAPITGYTVAYQAGATACPTNNDAPWNPRITSETTATITGLDNGTAYRICVKATNTAGDSGWNSTTATPAGKRIEWTNCGADLECGFVDVPADYRSPEADTIKIAVNVLRTASPEQRIGYLLVNPGGPGGSGVEFVASGDRFADQLLERFDIVGFDPRGVGASEPAFSCGASGEQLKLLAAIDMPIDSPNDIAAGEAAANLCIQSMGPVGGLLHSEYVARDMDEIRKALGVEQISYLGFSYGSTLGVWYATLFPQSVRAMAVDGADNPVDPASTRQERIEEYIEEVATFADVLDQALSACDDWRCPIYNWGNPVAYFRKAVTKLDLVNQAASGNPLAGVLGVLTTLYSQDYWPYLWHGLFELQEDNDPSIFLEFALLHLGEDPAAASFTAHVNCLDSLTLYPELDRDTLLADDEAAGAVVEERFPLLALLSPPLPSACLFYDQFAPYPLQGPLDGRGVPILVIGNHSDPATSFGESEELVTDTLTNGYLIETSHIAHVVYPHNECVNHHIHRALIDVAYPDKRRVVCESQK
jgi:pimeloyl-ACP methyl ester carboxylesterase